MADRGEIDRKSLRLYKARLAAAFDWGSVVCSEEGSRHGDEGPWLTAEGRWETRTFQQSEATTGFEATLDYPVFLWPETAVVPLNEALKKAVRRQCKSERDSYSKAREDDFPKGAWLSGSFGVSAITASFVSVRFTLHSCVWGSHGHAWNVPLSYFLAPFRRLSSETLFRRPEEGIQALAHYCASELSDRLGSGQRRDATLLARLENLRCPNLSPTGLVVSFDDYQVTAYAEGAPEILVPFEAVAEHLAEDIPRCVGLEL